MSFRRLPPGYLTKSTAIIVSFGSLGFYGFQLASGNEHFHEKYLLPSIRHMIKDCESTHKLALCAAKLRLFPLWGDNYREYPELQCTVMNRKFTNPIGLAAGFDKNAESIRGLLRVGFGLIEIGSVTRLPQSGNEKPRLFLLEEDESLINRYGFNSAGYDSVLENIRRAASLSKDDANAVPFGVNLGKNKDCKDTESDYQLGIRKFAPHCDYLVVNISSPNTPGLTKLQDGQNFDRLLKTVTKTINNLELSPDRNRPRLLVKVSPDLDKNQRKEIALLCMNSSIDGLIVSNTTTSRPVYLRSIHKNEPGGLSGPPLFEMALESVRDFYRITDGLVAIIACGGVSNGEDAYKMIRAGASIVQIYTIMVYHGFPVVGRMKRELAECLKKDGFDNIAQVIGIDHRTK